MPINLVFGWVWITTGLVSGAVVGMYFYDPDWLGGYSSWRRRMVRLGHISFLGTGLLNLAFAFTVAIQAISPPPQLVSWLFVAGALTMPLVCFLSAWRDNFRYLFLVPVVSLIGGGVLLIVQVLR